MSDFITDEMVEEAAKARWDYERAESGDTTEWDMRYPSFREFDLGSMRAALRSVAPLIAAQALRDAADDYQWGGWANLPQAKGDLATKRSQAEHAIAFLRDRTIERGES